MQTQHTSTMRRVMATTLSAVLMLSMSTSSFAQSPKGAAPTTFEKGNYFVRTTEGAELHGQLERMDRDSLTLRVGTEPWIVPMDRVEKVQRRGDSLKNGATIGAVLVGGLFIWPATLAASEPALGGEVAVALVIGGVAGGALYGALIDKLISSNHTLYQRPGLALAPTRGGVTVSYHLPLGGR